MDATTREKIREHYQKGQGSIQDYARIYKVSMDEVLEALGENHLRSVDMPGDLITEAEAGPGATMNRGDTIPVPFTLN